MDKAMVGGSELVTAGLWRRVFGALLETVLLTAVAVPSSMLLPEKAMPLAYLVALGYPAVGYVWRGQTVGKWILGTRVVTNRGGRPGLVRCIVRVVGQTIFPVVASFTLLVGGTIAMFLHLRLTSPAGSTDGLGGLFALAVSMIVAAFVTAPIVVTFFVLWPLTNERRRAVHDYMAGTRVVRVDSRTRSADALGTTPRDVSPNTTLVTQDLASKALAYRGATRGE